MTSVTRRDGVMWMALYSVRACACPCARARAVCCVLALLLLGVWADGVLFVHWPGVSLCRVHVCLHAMCALRAVYFFKYTDIESTL